VIQNGVRLKSISTKPAMSLDKAERSDTEARAIEPATQTVLTRLREMIVTGEIVPGARLRAEALAVRLAVSRTPIRIALAVLATEGLVSYSVNRGYTAEILSIREILDALEVRAMLEGQAARLSVDYGWHPDDIAILMEAVHAGRVIVDAAKWSEAIEYAWYSANREFHRIVARASNNRVLRNAIRISIIYPIFGDVGRLSPAVAPHVPQRLRRVSETVPDHIIESQNDHEAIVSAIQADNAIEADRLMTAHGLKSRERLNMIANRR
jgi:GntR family transcriptional regulator, vanillate catabolism transcriptional regulator